MPLALRLTLTYLLVTLGGVIILGAGLLTLARGYLAQQQAADLDARAALAAELLANLAADTAALPALAQGGALDGVLPPGGQLRLFSPAGALLSGAGLGPFPSRPALALVAPPVPLPASQAAGRRYAARSIAGPGGPLGVVEVSAPTAAEAALLATLQRLTAQAALAAAAAVTLASLVVARTIARPVVALAARAEALAADLPPAPAAPAAPRPRGEIAMLAHSLDGLEARLRAYTRRIAELEQARAQFLRGVSHDLRTPLTAISGTLENLSDGAAPEQRPALATLQAETARLARLVDGLLAPPADGALSLDRRRLDLAALAEELAALLAGRARRAGVALICTAEGPAPVWGDRDRLKQAAMNLLDNALRVTPPGGVVELGVAPDGPGRLALLVADEGPGVPPELRERIWQRGERAGADEGLAGAAGLGLAIVREIAEAHGGSARLDEAPPPGATFIISLPRA